MTASGTITTAEQFASPTGSTAPLPLDWCAEASGFWQGLADRHGTPYYFYDADHVRRRIAAVRAAASGQARVYIAVKANPNLGLLRALVSSADGADISSGGELAQARLAGFDPEAMSFAGPAKTDAELAESVDAGVGAISVESLREIDACAAIARRLGRPARILLRINPLLPSKSYGMKMGGKAVQFGIDEEAVAEAESRILAHGAAIDFRGIHTYVGSQCFDAAGVVETTTNAIRLAREIAARSGLVSRKINVGGGFGVAHAAERRELDLGALAQALVPVLARAASESPGAQVIFELGRFLVAEAGIYVTRVVDVKTSRGRAFVTCDGGLNHQLAAAGTFGAALRAHFPLINLSRPDALSTRCSIAGPSCNPTDLLGVDVTLPHPAPGDLIGVAMSGSYGLTASPVLFLGRNTPAELVRADGRIVVGRAPHRITDFN